MGFVDLVEELGQKPWEILRDVDLRPSLLLDADELIPVKSYLGALDLAAKLTHRENFGLLLGRRQGVGKLGPVAMLAKQCENLRESLSIICRYVMLHDPCAVVFLEQQGDRCSLHYSHKTTESINHRHICDVATVVSCDLIRSYAGKHWSPLRVSFGHAKPRSLKEYREIFNAPIFFDQPQYSVTFETALLENSPCDPDPEIKRFFRKNVVEQDRQYTENIVVQVEHLVITMLGGGCNERRVADALQMSRRTLQRKLKIEGSSFSQLLAGIRFKLACRYLSASHISLSDLADALGYSELSAFTRFFTGYYGCSPSQYREIHSE